MLPQRAVSTPAGLSSIEREEWDGLWAQMHDYEYSANSGKTKQLLGNTLCARRNSPGAGQIRVIFTILPGFKTFSFFHISPISEQ